MDGSELQAESPVVLRFEGLYPHQLGHYEAHRLRKGGDLGHVDRSRPKLNERLIGEADWAAQRLPRSVRSPPRTSPPNWRVEIAKPKATMEVATATRRMLQRIHPLIKDYEAAQDSVGEWLTPKDGTTESATAN